MRTWANAPEVENSVRQVASRRALQADIAFQRMIATLFPDIETYEQMEVSIFLSDDVLITV